MPRPQQIERQSRDRDGELLGIARAQSHVEMRAMFSNNSVRRASPAPGRYSSFKTNNGHGRNSFGGSTKPDKRVEAGVAIESKQSARERRSGTNARMLKCQNRLACAHEEVVFALHGNDFPAGKPEVQRIQGGEAATQFGVMPVPRNLDPTALRVR